MAACFSCKEECFFKDVSKSREIKDLFGGPCDLCKRTFCKKCSKISSNEIRVLCSPSRMVRFYCPECLETVNKALEDLPGMKRQIDELVTDNIEIKEKLNGDALMDVEKLREEIKIQKVQLEKYIHEVKSSYNKIKTEITDEIQSETQILRDQLVSLEDKFKQNKSPSYADVVSNLDKETKAIKLNLDAINNKINSNNLQSGDGHAENVEPTLVEMQERDTRAFNVLIFGAAEANSEVVTERKSHDEKIVKEILDCVESSVNVDQLKKIIRLGKYDPNRCRPIKMVFPTKDNAKHVLRNRNKIPKETGKYLKYDQTNMQRTYLKKVMDELQVRTNQGECDLKIRYFGGIPKIIKSRPSKTDPKN